MSWTTTPEGASPSLIDDPMHVPDNPNPEKEEDEADQNRNSGEEDETDQVSTNLILEAPTLVFPYSCLLSIESVSLLIESGTRAPRRHEIYGKIMVTGRLGKVFAVFRRESDQPEMIAEGESRDLTLCGPMYSLYEAQTNHIHVRLYEKCLDGTAVPFLIEDMYIANKESEMSLERNGATLTVAFTRFEHSVPFKITISPPVVARPPWTLFGEVKAIQTVNTSFERTFVLFYRSAENGVQLAAGEHIPLDRSLVLSPVQRDIVGPSLTILVKLCFVEKGKEIVNKLNGRKNFVFRSDDFLSSYPIRDTFPLKRSHPDLDSSSSDAPDSLDIMVKPYFDSFIDVCEDQESENNYMDLMFSMRITPPDEEESSEEEEVEESSEEENKESSDDDEKESAI